MGPRQDQGLTQPGRLHSRRVSSHTSTRVPSAHAQVTRNRSLALIYKNIRDNKHALLRYSTQLGERARASASERERAREGPSFSWILLSVSAPQAGGARIFWGGLGVEREKLCCCRGRAERVREGGREGEWALGLWKGLTLGCQMPRGCFFSFDLLTKTWAPRQFAS